MIDTSSNYNGRSIVPELIRSIDAQNSVTGTENQTLGNIFIRMERIQTAMQAAHRTLQQMKMQGVREDSEAFKKAQSTQQYLRQQLQETGKQATNLIRGAQELVQTDIKIREQIYQLISSEGASLDTIVRGVQALEGQTGAVSPSMLGASPPGNDGTLSYRA